MKFFHVVCLTAALVMVPSCTLLQGDTTTTKTAIDLVRITHDDQRIALEGLLGHAIDLDGDGTISAVEWDGASLTTAMIYASGDEDRIEELKALIATRRFQVWAAAVIGDLALQNLEDRLAEDAADSGTGE